MKRLVGGRRYRWLALLVAGLLAGLSATGCMPEIPEDEGPPVERVEPILDSEAQTLPIPNDLALDDEGTIPDQPGIEEDSALGAFNRFLTEIHGWLLTQAPDIPFNGKLDPETVTKESVKIFRLTGDGELEPVETAEPVYEEAEQTVTGPDGEPTQVDGSRVTIAPADGRFDHGQEYVLLVTKDVADPEGEAIVESQAIFFGLSQQPLVDENGEKTIESLPDDQTAQDLESLRQFLSPVVSALADEGFERNDIAMVAKWTTLSDPQTILDPASATLPLPNTAALDEDGTFPDSAVDLDDTPDEQDAQEHFDRYLAQLHGWPDTTPITLPIAGSVDEETLTAENFQLWGLPEQMGGMAKEFAIDDVGYDAEAGVVTLTPGETLPLRRRYVAFATSEVQNTDGLSLKLPTALWMAIQPFDVVQNGESTIPSIPDEDALSIAALRTFLRPAAQFVEANTDQTIQDLGAIWSWQTWTDTFIVFDPAGGNISIPNEFVRRGVDEQGNPTGEVTLPVPDNPNPLEESIFNELNNRFGFSTTAPGWFPVDGPLDTETLTKDNVKFLFNDGVPKLYDQSVYRLDYEEEWDQIVARTNVPWMKDPERDPLADDFQSLSILTKDLMGGNGHQVQPSPAFVFLRSPAPIFEDGESTIEQLPDDSAEQLEPARQIFNQLLTFAPSLGIGIEEREDVVFGAAFHPQNTTQSAQELRAQALAKVDGRSEKAVGRACEPNCPADATQDPNYIDQPGMSYRGPGDNFDPVNMDKVQIIQQAAEFDAVNFLDGMSRLQGFDMATDETVGITVYVPAEQAPNDDCSAPFDVAFAQHGLGSWRVEAGRALANELADRCVALVTMDFLGHGGRASGSMTLHPETRPMNSGQGFLSTDIVGSKNRVLQSMTDLAVLAEIVAQGDQGGTGGLEDAIDDDSNTNFFDYDGGGEIG